ncbi:hypothetical protein [Compostibacter hankyongensis]|uniref:Molecular chaperone n=1 Tax=Compostibacter hankyongensis TaxID=1007089 RepID=A0ABP8FQ64_9BACT
MMHLLKRMSPAVLAFILCLGSISAASGQGLSVAPSRIFFSGGAPGQTLTTQLALSNTGKAPVAFSAAMADWKRDSTGNKIYAPVGSLPGSNASWVETRPALTELAPGERKEVTVLLHIPGGQPAKALSHSMLFLTQVNAQNAFSGSDKQGNKVGIDIRLQVGIHIYYTPPGLAPGNLELVAFEDRGMMAREKDTIRRLVLKVRNTGAAVMDGNIRFELTSKESGEELPVPPRAVSLLPGAEQLVYMDLPAHLQGHFLAVALVDSGAKTHLKVAEKEVVYGP